MDSDKINIVIEGDEEVSAAVAKEFRSHPDTRIQEQKIDAITGDPNIWVLVAQSTAAVVTAVAPIIVALINRKKKIVVNGVTFENVEAATVERVVQALKAGHGKT